MNSDLKDDLLIQGGGFRVGRTAPVLFPRLCWFMMKIPVWGRGRDKKVTGFYYVSVPDQVMARKS